MPSHTASPITPPARLVPPGRPTALGSGPSPLHDSTRARFTLPAHETLVSCLRSAARTVLARWRLPDDDQDAAVLIVGELAANAAVHGRSEMSLHLILTGSTLGIVVGDHGDPAASQHPGTGGDPDEHGRGLDIVHCLSTRVDVHQDAHGTWILACLAVPPPAGGTHAGRAAAHPPQPRSR